MVWILRIGVAVMTAVVLLLGAIALIPAERIAGLAARELEARTGRTVSIAGPVRPSIWPVLGVETGPVRIGNAEWTETGPFLEAAGLDLGLDLTALVRGEVVIERLVLTAPVLSLERSAEGVNWDFAGSDGTTNLSAALVRAQVEDGRIIYIDHRTGRKTDVGGLSLKAAMPETGGPLMAKMAARVNGQDVEITLSAEDGAAMLSGRVAQVNASVAAGAARLEFDGRAGAAAMVAEGSLSADLGDARALAAFLGLESLAFPEGLGARTIALTGQVTVAPEGSAHVRGMTLTLDGNSLTGAADMIFDGPRPKVIARLSAGALAIPGVAASVDARGENAGWSAEPLVVTNLGSLDAEVAIQADSLMLGPLAIAPLAVQVTLDRARAVTDIGRLGLFGGSVAGQFVVNDRDGLSVGGNISISGVNLEAALSTLAGYKRISGTGSGEVRFLGVGETVAAIMASLEGDGNVDLGPGDFGGLDLAAILRALDPAVTGDGHTDFDRVAASFTMDGGVLSNRDLRLSGPGIAAEGQGTIGLGAQVLDYRLTAIALAGADGKGGIGVPLRVSGPWADPRLTLDLKALAERELAEQRAEMEARAGAAAEAARLEVETRLREETGIDPQDGETLEDSARRRAGELLEEEAGRFLEGLVGQGE